jgi:hypothetical protein
MNLATPSFCRNYPEKLTSLYRRAIPAFCFVFMTGTAIFGHAQEAAQVPPATSLEPPKPARLNIVDSDLIPSVGEARPGKVIIEGLNLIPMEEARAMIGFQVRVLEENGVTMARADDASFFLEEGIRDLGYQEAKVVWEITPGNDVLLTVQEISKAPIESVPELTLSKGMDRRPSIVP